MESRWYAYRLQNVCAATTMRRPVSFRRDCESSHRCSNAGGGVEGLQLLKLGTAGRGLSQTRIVRIWDWYWRVHVRGKKLHGKPSKTMQRNGLFTSKHARKYKACTLSDIL